MNRSLNITLVIIPTATITVMAGTIIAPVLNEMRTDLKISATETGFIITFHALFVALFSPLVGDLIDKIGTKWPLVFGLMIYGAAAGSGFCHHT